ncbi:MAG: molybdenum cofactor guanylyltransferase [Deltaproteobacteria bacterium]|nr:molybdenum cofactor guanylyltransferase [Deltaproteobacteria bacterium]
MITGAILHGGRSSRMGRDKAFVVVAGQPMRDHVRAALLTVCERVVQVGGQDADVVDDGDGPFAAVLALLRSGIAERYLVCPVDQPFLTAAVLQPLIDVDDDVPLNQIVCWEGEPLPLCVRASALPRLERLYAQGERRMKAATTTTLVLPSELGTQLRNLNRPEDL